MKPRRKTRRKSRHLSPLAANLVWLGIVAAGTLPLWHALAFSTPPTFLMTVGNAVPVAGCLALGFAASSVIGKSFCLAWACAVGGAVRQSRSRLALGALVGANGVALLWVLR